MTTQKQQTKVVAGSWREYVKQQSVNFQGLEKRRPLQPQQQPEAPKVDPARSSGRAMHEQGRMNRLETSYAAHLELRKLTGEIRKWAFEPVKLRLAQKTYYNPDFWVVFDDGAIEIHETKGHWEDDARVKVKCAAVMFPEFAFVGVTWDKKQGWKFEYFKGE